MELWVRSQKRNILEKVSQLYVTTYDEEEGFGIYARNYDDLDDCDIPLGFYKTRERALEVLDEIQKLLTPQLKTIRNEIEERKIKEFSREILVKPVIEDVKICQFETYVYEMPIE